ncbi:hypothetical protein J3F83DRAFT_288996 [Trichoderma novae-zelandiae]
MVSLTLLISEFFQRLLLALYLGGHAYDFARVTGMARDDAWCRLTSEAVNEEKPPTSASANRHLTSNPLVIFPAPAAALFVYLSVCPMSYSHLVGRNRPLG